MTTSDARPAAPEPSGRDREPAGETTAYFAARPARGDRGRGVVVVQSGDDATLRAWDVAAGTVAPSGPGTDGFDDSYWPSADGRLLYRLADDGGDEIGHVEEISLGTGERRDLTPGMAPYTVRGGDASLDGSTVAFAAVNADGFQVVAVPAGGAAGGGGQARTIYASAHEAWQPKVSADGRLAVVDTTDHDPGRRHFTVTAVDVATGRRLGSPALPAGGRARGACFSPAPGDPRVLVAVSSGPHGCTRPMLWHPPVGAADGAHGALVPLDVPGVPDDAEVVPLDWSPDAGSVLLLVAHHGAQRVAVHTLATGRTTEADLPPGAYWLPEVYQPWFDGAGGLLVPFEDAATPLTVLRHRPDGGPARVVLGAGPGAGPRARSVTFPSADGTLVQGWLLTPPGDGPFPAVVSLHGGPHWSVPDAYDREARAWLTAGYAHLAVNFRGSTGRGTRFAEQIHGDLGRLELDDVAAARRALVDSGTASASEVFVTGASYGGYLTLHALARQPELWAGGFASMAIADWALTYRDASDALRAAIRSWFGGTPEELPALYADRSPATHLDAVSAPVVVVHGERDSRTPPEQMRAFVRAMRERGKDVTAYWYGAGHGRAPGADVTRFLAAAERIRAARRATTTP